MIVTSDIKKTDYIRLNLTMVPRLKSTYMSLVPMSIFIFILLSWKRGIPDTTNEWIAFLVGSTIGSFLATLIVLLLTIISILVRPSKNNGTLGLHEYKISHDGLYEKTSANEGLSRWEGIQNVSVFGSYIFFNISGHLFHIIPERSFDSHEKFQEYAAASINYWEKAHDNNKD